MANFSDDDDLGSAVVAEAREPEWSDSEDEEENPTFARTHAIWSEDDDATEKPEKEEEEEEEEEEEDLAIRAGALFGGGGKGDPIGDLREKAKKLSRGAADSFEKYVRGAAAETKKLREARRKVTALQSQGQKKMAQVEKDKKLDESAKEAQREQFKTLVADIAEITGKIEENEKWLNTILGQSTVSTAKARSVAPAPAFAPEWIPAAEKVAVAAGATASRKTASRNMVIHVPGGAELSWIRDGNTGTHRSVAGGQVFSVKAGAKFEMTNRTASPVTFTLVH